MEALLLGIYAFFVWLIFIKFKWLPWTTTSKVVTSTCAPMCSVATAFASFPAVSPAWR